ncbi:MAG TPA: hypothetical protein V6C57_19895 [Coleofasciculaceae cyanobacterium]
MSSRRELSEQTRDRQIKKYQRTTEARQDLPKPSPTVRISNHDPVTGRDNVIHPSGSETTNGARVFNASVPTGSYIQGLQGYGNDAIALNHKSATPIIQPVEEVKKIDTPIKILFSTVTDGVREFFIGGDRKNPTKILEAPDNGSTIGNLTSLGKGVNDWVAGVYTGSDIYYTIHPNRVQSFAANLYQQGIPGDGSAYNESYNWLGYGTWATLTDVSRNPIASLNAFFLNGFKTHLLQFKASDDPVVTEGTISMDPNSITNTDTSNESAAGSAIPRVQKLAVLPGVLTDEISYSLSFPYSEAAFTHSVNYGSLFSNSMSSSTSSNELRYLYHNPWAFNYAIARDFSSSLFHIKYLVANDPTTGLGYDDRNAATFLARIENGSPVYYRVAYSTEAKDSFLPWAVTVNESRGAKIGLSAIAFLGSSMHRAYLLDFSGAKNSNTEGMVESAVFGTPEGSDITLSKQASKKVKVYSLKSPTASINAIAYSP